MIVATIILGILTITFLCFVVAIAYQDFFSGRKWWFFGRNKCPNGCDPQGFVTIWTDGISRKARCPKCKWVHHVRGVRMPD